MGFSGSMKDARITLVAKNTGIEFFVSAHINNSVSTIFCLCVLYKTFLILFVTNSFVFDQNQS